MNNRLFDILKKYEIVSFDIFDTVLFRAVKSPQDVFLVVAKKAGEAGCLNAYYKPGDFLEARVQTEEQLYRTKGQVNLKEIYHELPDKFGNLDRIREIEVLTECELCYMNPEMMELIDNLYMEGVKIIFTSDMYLSKVEMEKVLLASGVDLEKIDKIFISCDYGAAKKDTGLFMRVLDTYHILPEKLCHIGDDYEADVYAPSKKGIQGIYYPVKDFHHETLFMEKLAYGSLAPEVLSIRKLISNDISDMEMDSEQKKWTLYGAQVAAPFYTAAMEWVLDMLEEEGIDCLYLLMREGEFFNELLEQAVRERKAKIELKLLYSSRNAWFLCGLENLTKKQIPGMLKELQKEKVTVGGVFKLLEIEEYFPEELTDIKKVELRKLNADSLFKLSQYLSQDDMFLTVLKNIKRCRNRCKKYLKSIGYLEKRVATLDFGYKGTVQKIMDCFTEYQPLNLLVFGLKTAFANIKEGHDIVGYMGSCGNEGAYVVELLSAGEMMECMLMRGTGCTMSYDEFGNPVLGTVRGIEKQSFENIRAMHEGIKLFQKKYLKIQRYNSAVREVKKRPKELLSILGRSLIYPTPEEVSLLSSVVSEDNFGNDLILKSYQKEDVQYMEWEDIWKAQSEKLRVWKAGMAVMKDPLIFIRALLLSRGQADELLMVESVLQLRDTKRSVVIVGAGLAGKRVYSYCVFWGMKIEAFVDNDEKKQGTFLFGVPVVPLERAPRGCAYLIASIKYKEVLIKQVKDFFGDSVEVC